MSRASLPKQLLPIIRGKSLLSLAWERLEGIVDPDRRLVCAAEAHRASIAENLPALSPGAFLGEPVGRDTLNALAYTAAVVARRDPYATIGVFTADHLIEPVEKFRAVVAAGYDLAERREKTLVTFGITPRSPSTSYGYLSLGAALTETPPGRKTAPGARIVEQFKEKPDAATAASWVAAGPERFLWNSGMFAWQASTFLECVRRYEPATFDALRRVGDAWGTPAFGSVMTSTYPSLKKISVDFAVMERASLDPAVTVAALPMELSWLDIGSWPAFSETCRADDAGNSISAGRSLLLDCRQTLVASSDPGHLVAALGCDDLMIVHTPDATLVCRRDRAEDVKKLHAMVAERFGRPYE